MDPSTLSQADWTDIGDLLTNLWITVGLVVIFATNMLIGLIAIPSLAQTHHIPEKTQKLRPLFYVAAVISFGLAMFFLSRAADEAGVIRSIWERYWI